jgi:hypothetical protein
MAHLAPQMVRDRLTRAGQFLIQRGVGQGGQIGMADRMTAEIHAILRQCADRGP